MLFDSPTRARGLTAINGYFLLFFYQTVCTLSIDYTINFLELISFYPLKQII